MTFPLRARAGIGLALSFALQGALLAAEASEIRFSGHLVQGVLLGYSLSYCYFFSQKIINNSGVKVAFP